MGSVASGKSTLQNFLVHRLHVDENVYFDRTSADGNTVSEAYLNAWVQNIAAGYLPERTSQGVLREFNVRFGQERPRCDFSFIEIAGEDIRSILPTSESKQPRLHEHLERYLRQRGVNKRFLFISDASRNRVGKGRYEEDLFLFDSLLRYLLSDTGIGMKHLNILFIAAKWDVVQNEYKSDQQYFRTNFPQTRSTIKAHSNIRAAYMPFSVGQVVLEKTESGSAVARLKSIEKKYVEILINWIYHSFTQRTLRGYPKVTTTMWDRIKNYFA